MLIFFLLIFIFIILYLPLNLRIEYQRERNADKFNFQLYTFVEAFGISIQIPYLKNRIFLFISELISEIDYFFNNISITEEKGDFEEKIQQKNKQIENIKKAVSLIKDRELMELIFRHIRIKCLKFYWKTEFGLADPAYTAVLNGFIWIIKGIVLKICDDLTGLNRDVELFVNPDFYKEKLSTSFICIFTSRIGNIIITTVYVFLFKIRNMINSSEFFYLKYR